MISSAVPSTQKVDHVGASVNVEKTQSFLLYQFNLHNVLNIFWNVCVLKALSQKQCYYSCELFTTFVLIFYIHMCIPPTLVKRSILYSLHFATVIIANTICYFVFEHMGSTPPPKCWKKFCCVKIMQNWCDARVLMPSATLLTHFDTVNLSAAARQEKMIGVLQSARKHLAAGPC